jgi:hypothetical protein
MLTARAAWIGLPRTRQLHLLYVACESGGVSLFKATGGNVQLFWSMDFANATVETSASLGPPAMWSPVAGAPTIQEGRYTMTIPAASNPSIFYRLKVPLTYDSTAPMVTTMRVANLLRSMRLTPSAARDARKVKEKLLPNDDPGPAGLSNRWD